jgi:hypothetical protein
MRMARSEALSIDILSLGAVIAAAGLSPGAIVSKDISTMHFHSDPNLKPTEIQPPTTERRTPAVRARKPAARERLRRALRKGGKIALKGGMLVLILLGGAYVAYVASWWQAAVH